MAAGSPTAPWAAATAQTVTGAVWVFTMPITEAIQRIILAEGTAMDIAEQAKREGVRDLRQSGLVKVRAGVTTLEEVLAATNE